MSREEIIQEIARRYEGTIEEATQAVDNFEDYVSATGYSDDIFEFFEKLHKMYLEFKKD